MSECCSNTPSKITEQDCPQCGISCKSVSIKTLYHQVKFPNNQSINSGGYYYCPVKACAAGYFSTDGRMIPKQQLKSAQNIQDDMLCYCFDISEAQYRLALQANNAESIKHFVIEQTRSGTCACEIRNPSGQCCLAKFKQIEREFAHCN